MRLLRRREGIITARRCAGATACLAALPAVALAAPRPSPTSDRRLWATVNVCDTERWPDTIGIRGSMPASDDAHETMWMRFQVQFRSADDGKWRFVIEGGDSGFVAVGSARTARQAGRSFRISPKKGEQVLLRGRVTLEWRSKEVVTRREKLLTQKGHRSSAGSDPPGYTASTCTITPDS
jgi:hypothetical protein